MQYSMLGMKSLILLQPHYLVIHMSHCCTPMGFQFIEHIVSFSSWRFVSDDFFPDLSVWALSFSSFNILLNHYLLFVGFADFPWQS